jgi:acetyl-CoA carboxylase biotin carboxyl carrier protein
LAKPLKTKTSANDVAADEKDADILNEKMDMNLAQIQELIKFVAKSGVSEVSLEQKDFRITIKAQETKGRVQEVIQVAVPPVAAPAAAPAPAVAPAPAAAAAPAAPKAEEPKGNLVEIKSPMIGTFYRSSSPDKPPFAEVGSVIKQGDTVCIIEAMKLFNEIESEVSGKIVKVLVNDSTPIEYDQPLFLVEPA